MNDTGDFDDLEVSYSLIRYLTSPAKIPLASLDGPRMAIGAFRVLLLLGNASRVRRGKSPFWLSRNGHIALAEMKDASALFMSGAGTFNDLYVSNVGGLWGVVARCMSALEKPVVASGQQVGPLKKFGRRAIATWAVHAIDLLGVRDPESAVIASALRVPQPRVVLTGDDAWELAPAPPKAADAILKRHGIPRKFIAAQMRFGRSVGWDEADGRALAASLDRLSAELELPVVFVPCAIGRGQDDRYAAARVRKHLKAPSWALADELDSRATKAVLGKAVLAVGTANHFCVFAASAGTPVIGLYASPYMKQKLTGLASLWPSRAVAICKKQALEPGLLFAVARDLVDGQTAERGGGSLGRPAVVVSPEKPIRVLEAFLIGPPPKEPAVSASKIGTLARSID